MGATITWRPVKSGKSLPVKARSRFIEALDAAGLIDCPLCWENMAALAGICAALGEPDILTEIQDALECHDSIIITAEY